MGFCHNLLFRHLLPFWRSGCFVLIISELFFPGITNETAKLGRRKAEATVDVRL
jgi:hypothetical protein